MRFIKSVVSLTELMPSGKEIAFSGRSNVGKSSTLNALANISGLAKFSKTPGRTQMINYFSLAEECYLVDLPGYGYAKAGKAQQQAWYELMDQYWQQQGNLVAAIQIIDVRHPLFDADSQMLEWQAARQIPVLVLLNKADTLSNQQKAQVKFDLFPAITSINPGCQIEFFSAKKSLGIDTVRAWILHQFGIS